MEGIAFHPVPNDVYGSRGGLDHHPMVRAILSLSTASFAPLDQDTPYVVGRSSVTGRLDRTIAHIRTDQDILHHSGWGPATDGHFPVGVIVI